MSGLSLQFILELVDRLSGPAKDATRSLDGFKKASDGLSGSGGDQRARSWVETSRAIDGAADAVKGYGAAAIGAGAANDNIATSWIETGRSIVAAAESAKTFETASANAAERADAISAAWRRANEQIEYATGAARRFDEVSSGGGAGGRGGGGGRGGAGGHGERGGLGEMLKTAGELGLIMEAPRAIEETWAGGAHLTSETIAERIAGMSPAQIEESRKLGLGLQQQFPQFPLTEILKESREARAIFTTDEEARNALIPYLKMAAIQDRANPGEGLKESYPFLRAVEESGVTRDAQKTMTMFDAMQKAQNVMGAKIKPEDWFTAFQHAGAFGRTWSDEFIAYKLPHLLASLGGDAVGTMIATLGMAVQGGHLMGPALDTFDSLGLVKNGFAERKKGHITRVKPGGIIGGDILGHDFVEWAQDVLWPAIQKKTSDPAQQMALLTTALSNRNDLKAAYMAIMDVPQFKRTRDLLEPNKGLAAVGELDADPTVGWQKLKSSLETLASVASDPMMTPIAHGLDMLSGAISRFSGALDGHPVEQTAASLGFTGALAYAGWKAFTGIGSKIGSWFGGGGGAAAGGAAAEGAAGIGAEGAAVASTGLAMLGELAPPLALLGAVLYEALDPHSLARVWQDNLNVWSKDHFAWTNPTHEMNWSNPAERETALTQEYARQTDQHPILHGERDMEGAAGRAYAELARAQDEAAAKAAEPIAPKVDASAIDALNAKLQLAVRLLGQVAGGVAQGYTLGPGGASARGGALHDGPEAR